MLGIIQYNNSRRASATTMQIRSAIIISVLTALTALSQADTTVPTSAAPSSANVTLTPTASPTNFTNSSAAPSMTPTALATMNSTEPTSSPTPAPSESNSSITDPPSVVPSAALTTVPPTTLPTQSPSLTPSVTPVAPKPHKTSIGKIIAKTVGWLILIALSVLGFGAAMSNRYQIYYALRGVWYTILQMECTRWIMTKLNLGGAGRGGTNASLNEIIFDNNDLTEGLLMGDT